MNIAVSFSGGRTSAFMAKWVKENIKYDKIVFIFANTGKERLETLDFVRKCDEFFDLNLVWVEAEVNPVHGEGTTHKTVNYYSSSRNGEPFERVIQKFGIPNVTSPICTRELKERPIKSYLRVLGWENYYTAIGIRADEPSRLNWDTAKKKRIIYPLAKAGITKKDINYFWSKQPFDLELKSYEGNCDLCWKKSFRKLKTIIKDNPELAQWWIEMQDKYGSFIPETQVNRKDKAVNFFRQNTTMQEIIEESKFPFDPARDESKEIDKYKQMSIWDEYEDGNDGCSESCEVYL